MKSKLFGNDRDNRVMQRFIEHWPAGHHAPASPSAPHRQRAPREPGAHARQRLRERYGVIATDLEMLALAPVELVPHSHGRRNALELHRLEAFGASLVLLFSRCERRIVTVLPREAIAEDGRLRVK